jgi:long-chain acyl-CoA synthetase
MFLEKSGKILPPTMKGFICGGAHLDAETERFFREAGVPVFQGYGMTETSPVISVNSRSEHRAGSAGKPLPGIEVKIAPDGEILTRGPHVMQGYYKRKDLTGQGTDPDGWLHTGDIGEFDADGYLYITGRRKNLIVLSTGKKVHPEEVERALENSSLWKEICVCGVNRNSTEETCAVIVQPLAEESAIRMQIDRMLQNLAPYKRPQRFYFRQEELPRTPTRKIKRHLVREWIELQNG